jgi:hypothetical protein
MHTCTHAKHDAGHGDATRADGQQGAAEGVGRRAGRLPGGAGENLQVGGDAGPAEVQRLDGRVWLCVEKEEEGGGGAGKMGWGGGGGWCGGGGVDDCVRAYVRVFVRAVCGVERRGGGGGGGTDCGSVCADGDMYGERQW